MHINASTRVNQLSTGIFSELAARKQECIGRGLDVIDLSVGSPDLPPPEFVRNAIAEFSENPANYGYTLKGTAEFNEAVVHFYQQRYGVELSPDGEVLQLMGSQDGLAHLATAIINPGDYVLVPDPGYPIYEASVTIAGGNIYPMPLLEENYFLPVLNDIPPDILAKAKMMIMSYPGNPVTALATREFFQEVVAFAKKHDILVVHDFAYSELIFDDHEPLSFLTVEGAKEVGIEFNSLSKTFNMAGCRIGYVVGNQEVLKILTSLKSHLDYGVFLPIQKAAEVALTSDYRFLEAQRREYKKRRDTLVESLNNIGWEVHSSPATMFIWSRIPKGWTSRGFAIALLEQKGVALVPGNAFGSQGEGYVRLALVQPPNRLKDVAQRIKEFLQANMKE